jgi:Sec-independent protein translocase protein TatA
VKFEHRLKCAFCWRGGLFEKGHAHTSCPFLSAQNKVRKQLGLQPIQLMNGRIIRVDEPIVEDLHDTIKGLKKELDDVKSRLVKLENADKRKTETPVDSSPPKKKVEKAADNSASGSRGSSNQTAAPKPKGGKNKGKGRANN